MGVHQSRARELAIPAEILQFILDALPRSKRKHTICAARLVCHAWNQTLAVVLFQNATFTLSRNRGPHRDQLHDLEALAELLGSSPYLCSLVESLKLEDWLPHHEDLGGEGDLLNEDELLEGGDEPAEDGDEAPPDANSGGFGALVGVDEGEYDSDLDNEDDDSDLGDDNFAEVADEGDEHDYAEGELDDEEVSVYQDSEMPPVEMRCETDPVLLRRVLLYLPRLHHLHLRNISVSKMLQRDGLDPALLAPLKIPDLRLHIAGWYDVPEYADQVAYLMKITLTMFDSIDSLRLVIGWDQRYYTNLPKNVLAEPEPVIPYQIRSFTAIRVLGVQLRTLALSTAFRGLEHLRWKGVQARTANPVLIASGGTLRTLHLTLAEPHKEEDEEEPKPVDLSQCIALADLTLVFNTHTHHPSREQAMSKLLNSTLRTLLNRAPSTPAIADFTLRFELGGHEPRRDGEWKLSPTSMHMLEDTLLELVEAGACASVSVRFDLQPWYYSQSIRASPRWNEESTDQTVLDLETKYKRNAKICEMTLVRNLPRLRERRLVTVEEVPITNGEAYREDEMGDYEDF